MKTLRRILHLAWLNFGYYSALVTMTVVAIVVVSLPMACWLRFRGYDTGAAVRHLIWHYGRAWTKLLLFFVPVRLENCDRPLPRPYIVTPNHQSFFDTYCFSFMPEKNIVFAVRAWPFRIPFYGLYMRLAGYPNSESGDLEALLHQCKTLLDAGVSICIFPEGHRSPNGKIQRFHSGAFYLSVLTGTPVVPLCIDGTGIFLPKGRFLVRPATVHIRALEPIYPEQFMDYGEEAPIRLRQAVKTAIQQSLHEVRSFPSVR